MSNETVAISFQMIEDEVVQHATYLRWDFSAAFLDFEQLRFFVTFYKNLSILEVNTELRTCSKILVATE